MALLTAVAIIGIGGLLVLAMWRQPTCYTREYIDIHPEVIAGWSDAELARVYDMRCATTRSSALSTLAVLPAALLLYCVGNWVYYGGTWIESRWTRRVIKGDLGT